MWILLLYQKFIPQNLIIEHNYAMTVQSIPKI